MHPFPVLADIGGSGFPSDAGAVRIGSGLTAAAVVRVCLYEGERAAGPENGNLDVPSFMKLVASVARPLRVMEGTSRSPLMKLLPSSARNRF